MNPEERIQDPELARVLADKEKPYRDSARENEMEPRKKEQLDSLAAKQSDRILQQIQDKEISLADTQKQIKEARTRIGLPDPQVDSPVVRAYKKEIAALRSQEGLPEYGRIADPDISRIVADGEALYRFNAEKAGEQGEVDKKKIFEMMADTKSDYTIHDLKEDIYRTADNKVIEEVSQIPEYENGADWSEAREHKLEQDDEFLDKLEGLPSEVIDSILQEKHALEKLISDHTGVKNSDVDSLHDSLRLLKDSPAAYYEGLVQRIQQGLAERLAKNSGADINSDELNAHLKEVTQIADALKEGY